MFVDVLFIDFDVLMSDGHLVDSCVYSLKDVVKSSDNIRIVALFNDRSQCYANYSQVLNGLSQALNLKKSLFFDRIEVDACNMSDGIASWMLHSKDSVKSFAVVVPGKYVDVGKAYPNNKVFCEVGSFSEAHAKDACWIMSNFKSKISEDDNVWFISDTHFGHANIIKYCNRPWSHGKDENNETIVTPEDVLAMDNEMIKRWNSVVKPNDIVWHLGDFALGGKAVAERVFPQLNGRINLVMGNHDHWKLKWYYDLGFNRVYDRKVIIHDYVVLTHAPMMFLNSNCPFCQIYGHVHDSTAYPTWTKNSCCVCVERYDYTPVSWREIKKRYEEMNKESEG